MRGLLASRQVSFWTTALAGGAAGIGAILGVRRLVHDCKTERIARALFASSAHETQVFSPDLVADLPEPARRYLHHAIAPGTPLASAVRLHMKGAMTPKPGSPPLALTANETLAPRRGFAWTAHARMFGLPVRVIDHYFEQEGDVQVNLLGLVPIPFPGSREDMTRSSRGRLIGEAAWCPTVLVAPDVFWEAVDANRARFTYAVDGEAVSVTVHVGPDGAPRAFTLDRWGDVGVPSHRFLPYGFAVEEEATFEGITIPTRLRGGWWYGTDRYDPDAAATFTLWSATFAGMP